MKLFRHISIATSIIAVGKKSKWLFASVWPCNEVETCQGCHTAVAPGQLGSASPRP